MKQILVFTVSALVALAGCTKNDNSIVTPNEFGFTVERVGEKKPEGKLVATAPLESGTKSSDVSKPEGHSGLCIKVYESDLESAGNSWDMADNQSLTKGTIIADKSAFQTKYQGSGATAGFGVWGFAGNTLLLGATDSGSQVTYQSGSNWQSADSFTWGPAQMNFYAYAPFDKGSGKSITAVSSNNGSPTISYTALSAVENQADLLVAQSLNVSRTNSVALTFTHPLSAIVFRLASDFPTPMVLKSFIFKGIKNSGTYNIASDSWSLGSTTDDFALPGLGSGYDITASNKPSLQTSIDINDNGTMFMLPQELTSSSLVEILYNDGQTDKTARVALSSILASWLPGKKYTYIISLEAPDYLFEVSDLPSIPYNGVPNQTITITSTKTEDGTTSNVGWTVEYSATGTDGTWSSTAPSWFSVSCDGGNNVVLNCGGTPISSTGGIIFGPAKGTSSSPYNLSNSTGAATIQNTANCYIINDPGYYKLPLVYGNAIKDSSINSSAYTVASGNDNPFVNSANAAISSPYITTMQSGSLSADIVWQDSPNLVVVDGIEGSGQSAFLKFHIQDIQQGNAVVAAKIDGTIVWSWHIWVTDYVAGTGDFSYTSTTDNTSRTFMPYNLGWCHQADEASYAGFTYYLRFTQTESGTSVIKPLSIASYTIPALCSGGIGNNTYYQFGRKDPFPGSKDLSGNTNKSTYTTGSSSVSMPTISDGNQVAYSVAHQNPGMFYKRSSSPCDWCSTTFYSSWNSSTVSSADPYTKCDDKGIPVVKTIYDPCPVGYCVPNSYAFGGFSVSNLTFSKGYTWSGLFFPASGCRHCSYGSLGDVGRYGCYWSSCSGDSGNAFSLYFYSSGATPPYYSSGVVPRDYSYHRSNGFSVRPVREK